MKQKRFTEEQITFALRQAESGTAVEAVCRRLGISEATFYRWKKRYGGLGVPELRRLKQLEEESRGREFKSPPCCCVQGPFRRKLERAF